MPPRTPPTRLWAQAGIALLLLAVLAALTSLAALRLRADLRDLTTTARTRAAAAYQLHATLADLDAQHTAGLVPGGGIGNRQLALTSARLLRTQAGALIADLAEDGSAHARVAVLLDVLSRYDATTARADDAAGLDHPPGRPPQLALLHTEQSGDLFDTEALPQADALARAYTDRAADLADRAGTAGTVLGGATAGLGAATVGFLVWWQRDLARRYGRRFSPALLGATVLTAAVAVSAPLAVLSAADDTRTAVSGGLRAWQDAAAARVSAARAASAQASWLVVDPSQRPALAQQFAADTRRIATVPDAAVRQRLAVLTADDRRLRALGGAADSARAADLLTGVARRHLAFDVYDVEVHLDARAAARSAAFDAATGAGRADLAPHPALPLALLGAAAVGAWLGVRPRLAEYR
ncbi:hypothetical protein BIV57_07590 [Mangrovactinospora gilvigrisea]|uniref:Uncharacterized protein n=1 Tax=Mangrovactinospora gilvigrisea TaxID=1428644 RepID=A0A1J7BHE2_9ACTN|nr:hypothetical protein BIV57_07590 [Mangrovactinospora gilvigrisea]